MTAEMNKNLYAVSRFNAVRHGILSRQTVLPQESEEEYAALLQGLCDEYRPDGMTEETLVQELAAIIWRKRRVLLAEGAKVNEGVTRARRLPDK